MKLALKIVLGIVILLIIAVVAAWIMIDSIAKAGIEKGGTYAMGVDTTVQSVSLSLLNGHLAINDLKVANPEKFTSDHFMKSGDFQLQVDPLSVLGDVVHVQSFELDSLDLNVEKPLAGQSNLAVIMANLQRLGSSEKPPQEQPGKRYQIDKIVIKDVVAHFYLGADLTKGPPLAVKVPLIEINDLTSENSNGVVMSEVVRRIVPVILASVLESAKGIVPADFLKDANAQLASLADSLGQHGKALVDQAGKNIQQLIKEPGKALEGAGKGLEGAVGGLIGGLKKPEPNSAGQ